MALHLYNTLHRQKSLFETLKPSAPVKLYTCGPTVYNYAHIGNFRTYIFEDILRRVLQRDGFEVNHVMNVTDVGHLEGDGDDGEDKLAKEAARQKKDPWKLAQYYTDAFFSDFKKLNMLEPHTVCKATDHVQDMIDMVKTLEDKGFTYTVDGNVYFDISQFEDYSKLGRLNLEAMQSGRRVEVDKRKKNHADFALWFSIEGSKFKNQIMRWDSPWGMGFPGWHIECSAMSSKYLGEEIDIHCGGIDHVPVHHTNEIAQSECAFGHKWVNYWVHGEFLVMGEDKMSKSSGEFLTLELFEKKGFSPMHYRYFCLGAHYRKQLSFSWEALEGDRTTYENLCQRVLAWKYGQGKVDEKAVTEYKEKFEAAIFDDMNMPVALAVVWELAKNQNINEVTKLKLILNFDEVLGLRLEAVEKPELDSESMALIEKRNQARADKDWENSDKIRDLFLEKGLILKDTPDGTDWYHKID
jgi:cysteinyl-tRNA synthetase